MRLDYAASSNDNVVVANNYIAGGSGGGNYSVSALNYQSVIFTNNTVYTSNGYILQLQPKSPVASSTTTPITETPTRISTTAGLNTILPAGKVRPVSTRTAAILQNTVPPNKVVVNPNAYEPKRANIVVYNWSNANTVSVDVSNVLSPGDAFEVRNAQDYYAPPALTGTYTGSPLILPMTNLTVAAPTGWTDTNSVPTTGKQFNVFVLLGAGSSSSQSFRITSITRSGNNINLVWSGLPGTNVVQVSSGASNGSYSNNFVDWATIIMPSAGVTNYTDVGGATNSSRFYRIDLRQ